MIDSPLPESWILKPKNHEAWLGVNYQTKKTLHISFLSHRKLDGVGPVDNRLSTSFTPDMWHVTSDMWHTVGVQHSFKISASWLLWFLIYDAVKIWRKGLTHLINELDIESMNNKGVCRAALATPGLLNICFYRVWLFNARTGH